MVAACLAAMTGCMVGTCDVANTPEYWVSALIAAAKVKHSKPSPLKLVAPPKPFQRPTGTMASNSISSAMRASARALLPLGLQNAVDRRHGRAATQIAAERAELELPVVEKRI